MGRLRSTVSTFASVSLNRRTSSPSRRCRPCPAASTATSSYAPGGCLVDFEQPRSWWRVGLQLNPGCRGCIQDEGAPHEELSCCFHRHPGGDRKIGLE